MRLYLIANPEAKRYKALENSVSQVGSKLESELKLRPTSDPNDDLVRAVEDFAKEGHEALAIYGGDGTVSTTLSCFMNVLGYIPPTVILRGGTFNTTRKNIGYVDGSMVDFTSGYIIDVLKAESLDDLRIVENGLVEIYYKGRNPSIPKRTFGSLYGIGGVARFIEHYDDDKTGKRGPKKAIDMVTGGIRSIVSELLRGSDSEVYARQFFNPTPMEIFIGDEKQELYYTTALLQGTVPDVAFGFKLLRRAKEEIGVPHTLILDLEDYKDFLTASNLWRMHAGKEVKFNDNGRYSKMIDLVTKEPVIVEFTEDDQTFMIDGEIFPGKDQSKLFAGDKLISRPGPVVKFILGEDRGYDLWVENDKKEK